VTLRRAVVRATGDGRGTSMRHSEGENRTSRPSVRRWLSCPVPFAKTSALHRTRPIVALQRASDGRAPQRRGARPVGMEGGQRDAPVHIRCGSALLRLVRGSKIRLHHVHGLVEPLRGELREPAVVHIEHRVVHRDRPRADCPAAARTRSSPLPNPTTGQTRVCGQAGVAAAQMREPRPALFARLTQ